eukprot:1552769-Amphidinium_carterae.2
MAKSSKYEQDSCNSYASNVRTYSFRYEQAVPTKESGTADHHSSCLVCYPFGASASHERLGIKVQIQTNI